MRDLRSRVHFRWPRLILVVAVDAGEGDRDQDKDDRGEDAGFRSNRTAGEPTRAGERAVEEIVVRRNAAVGNAVEKSLSPIPSRVEADGPPEIPGSAQKNTEQQAEENYINESGLAFARIACVRDRE